MKSKLCLLVAIVLVILVACEGGGSVSGRRESCRSSGDSGRCEGGFNRLSGTYTQRIAADFYQQGDAVFVEATIAVEGGTLRVSVEAPDGTVAVAEASPSAPASLDGLSAVSRGMEMEVYIPLTYEALDGEATGVAYTVAYQRP